MSLRALSIRQPWAELILLGRKTIEVRSWTTAYRGPLLVHAAARIDTAAASRHGIDRKRVDTAALVGRCELIDCIPFSADTWEQWRDRHLNEGPMRSPYFAWVLRNPRRVTPIPFKGRLGLMSVSPELDRVLEGVQ